MMNDETMMKREWNGHEITMMKWQWNGDEITMMKWHWIDIECQWISVNISTMKDNEWSLFISENIFTQKWKLVDSIIEMTMNEHWGGDDLSMKTCWFNTDVTLKHVGSTMM